MPAAIPDEQAALLSAIVADPDADAPRLVYADWLQERGDEEQAQFIRESISLDWLEDHEDDLREGIAKRIDDTLTRNGPRWLDALGITGSDVTFDRGMVDGLVYEGAEQFVGNASTLFARVPVRSVTICDLVADDRDWLAVLADMPDLLRLRELRLLNGWVPVSSDGWMQLITSPNLANLRTLAVQDAALGDINMPALALSGRLAGLEELGLSGNRLTAAGVLSVVLSPRLQKLQRLGLAYNDIVEDRQRGSPYMVLRDALIARFDSTAALDSIV